MDEDYSLKTVMTTLLVSSLFLTSLVQARLDFTGSVVLMSYAWGSWGSRVTEHAAGAEFT